LSLCVTLSLPTQYPATASTMPVKRHTGNKDRREDGGVMDQEFQMFMRGLCADPRLGVHVRGLVDRRPAEIVLALAQALADCAEGRREHPAHDLLRRQEVGA
jgi:hypothetical protein